MNAVEIEQALSDLAAQAFDGEEFPFLFLAAFGNKGTTIQRLRKGDSNASDLPGGVLQRNHIHIAVTEHGQVGRALTSLKASPKTGQAKAKFILATDGKTLEDEELATGDVIFAPAHLDLTIEDRFGKPVKPREWYFVPLQAIDEAVNRIRDGAITKYVYDPKSARLVSAKK